MLQQLYINSKILLNTDVARLFKYFMTLLIEIVFNRTSNSRFVNYVMILKSQ